MISAVDISVRGAERETPRLPWRLPVSHLSASSLAMGAECPEKFRQRYVLHKKEQPGLNRVLGSAIHKALAENFDWKLARGKDLDAPATETAFLQAFTKECETATNENGGSPGWALTDEKLAAQDVGRAVVLKYLAEVAPRITPLAVEARFHEQLIPGLPKPIMGFIDLVADSGVIDYKSSTRKVSVAKSAWRLQGWIYQMKIPRPFQWHILTKTKEPAVYTPLEFEGLAMPYVRARVDWARRYVFDLANGLNYYYCTLGADQPWPTTGLAVDTCGRCSFKKDCPAW